MASFDTILDRAAESVKQLFAEKVAENYYFHHLHHTLQVVDAAKVISSAYSLSDEDRFVLMLAAWFHDTGYSETYDNHEAVGVRLLQDFGNRHHIEQQLINKAADCILATRMPVNPTNLLQQILCDADMAHLGSPDYADGNKLLRRELNSVFDKDISKKAWRKTNIEFLRKHRYFTNYARQHFEPVKQQNLEALLEKEGEPKEQVLETPVGPVEVKDKATVARTERGIATMFRIMSENHVSLSQMADSKANIMISVNTIVLSILVSVMLGKLQYYPQFIFPTALLSIVCLTAIIFAIRATRPNVNKGVFTEEDIKQKKVNLLFFGNFFNMDLKDYEWGMKEMMNDSEYLYNSMIKDIYYLGKVLAKKYHYLRISYNIFKFGLVLAVLAFTIASFLGMN